MSAQISGFQAERYRLQEYRNRIIEVETIMKEEIYECSVAHTLYKNHRDATPEDNFHNLFYYFANVYESYAFQLLSLKDYSGALPILNPLITHFFIGRLLKRLMKILGMPF